MASRRCRLARGPTTDTVNRYARSVNDSETPNDGSTNVDNVVPGQALATVDEGTSDKDAELAEARTKALAIFDSQPKTLKERIIKDAHNRQRVAAFPVLKMKLARALKELADIKAENEGLKEKPPGKAARPGGGGGAKPEESFEDYIRKSVFG